MSEHWFSDWRGHEFVSVDRGISYALAMAIGHPESRIALSGDSVQLAMWDVQKWKAMRDQGRAPTEHLWRTFDYRDPGIAWANSSHYNCFPIWSPANGLWHARSAWENPRPGVIGEVRMFPASTPQEAVARAVITIAEELGGVWRL